MNTLRPSQVWRKDAKASSSIHDTVNSHQFKIVLIMVLAELAQECSNRPDAGARIAGARDFVEKLLNIGQEPKRAESPSFNLPVEES